MQKILRIILFKMKYKIYTDGACSGNPGPGGWAVIILINNEIKEMFFGSEKNTTNNQMELLAPIKAIQKFKKKTKAEGRLSPILTFICLLQNIIFNL